MVVAVSQKSAVNTTALLFEWKDLRPSYHAYGVSIGLGGISKHILGLKIVNDITSHMYQNSICT